MDTVSPVQPATEPMLVTMGVTTRRVEAFEKRGAPQAPFTWTRYTVLSKAEVIPVNCKVADVAPATPEPLLRLVQALPLWRCHW